NVLAIPVSIQPMMEPDTRNAGMQKRALYAGKQMDIPPHSLDLIDPAACMKAVRHRNQQNAFLHLTPHPPRRMDIRMFAFRLVHFACSNSIRQLAASARPAAPRCRFASVDASAAARGSPRWVYDNAA